MPDDMIRRILGCRELLSGGRFGCSAPCPVLSTTVASESVDRFALVRLSVEYRARRVVTRHRLAGLLRWGCFLLMAGAMVEELRAEESAGLTTISAIRRMTDQQSEAHPIVRVRGVISIVRAGFFLQDDVGGIFVSRRGLESFDKTYLPGQIVEVEGEVVKGSYAPMVLAKEVTVVGQGDRPKPIRIGYEKLAGGVGHCQWVEVSGRVRSVDPDGGPFKQPVVEMMVDGRRLSAVFAHLSHEEMQNLPDSVVLLRGAAGGSFNRAKQLVQPVLFSYDIGEITVVEPAPEHAFDSPTTSIAQLGRFLTQSASLVGRRVKLHGEVLWHEAGKELFLRDPTGGIRVYTSSLEPLTVGDTVDVLGFPEVGLISPQLEDATYRKVGHNPPPRPLETTMEEMMNGLHEADLIQVEAVLLAVVNSLGNERIYLVRSGDNLFRAELTMTGTAVPDPEPGSRLRLTGVCVAVESDDSTRPRSRFDIVPREVRLLLRSPEDLVVLELPSWWNVTRVTWILLGTVLAAAVIIVLLEIRNRRKVQREAMAHAETEARFAGVLSERERIARELHDSVQQSLIGVRLQLEAATMRLNGSSDPTLKHIKVAHDFVRQGEEDVKRSIWDLRPQVLERHDLPAALREIAQLLNADELSNIQVHVVGATRRLSPSLEADLLRVFQEALTNALKHGAARSVSATIAYLDNAVTLRVKDDGVGFDSEATRPLEGKGHFGLRGIRERMSRYGGIMQLDSVPKNGTTLYVEIPQ